jgi:hypothetical protein
MLSQRGLCIDFVIVTIYNRAVASDFDDWEKVHGNSGWGAKDLVPLLKKVLMRVIHTKSDNNA